MNRKKKQIYLAVVIVGAMALIIDQTLLSESTPQRAAGFSPRGSNARGEVSSSGIQEGESAIPELHFPQDLPPLKLQSQLRDWFAPPAALVDGKEAGRASDNPAGDSQKPPDPSLPCWKRFSTTHRLEATFIHEGLRIAIVNGQWLRIGTEVGGCTLQAIAGPDVLFTCSDGEARLTLFEDLLSPKGEQEPPPEDLPYANVP